MSGRITVATAARVVTQLRRDRRTIALLLALPPALLVLLKYIFDREPRSFETIGASLIGLLPFIIMFLVSSITMLRERTAGTLERLMTMPLARLDLLLGYGIAFAALATIQALLTSAIAFGPLGLHVPGSTALVMALAVANAILGVALGLLISAFARSEFQAVQSCRGSSFRNCCCAACSSPVIGWRSCCRWRQMPFRSRTRSTHSSVPPCPEPSVPAGSLTSRWSRARPCLPQHSARRPCVDVRASAPPAGWLVRRTAVDSSR